MALSISFLLMALGAITVSAQTPPYNGPLLLQPLLSSGKCATADNNSNGAAVRIQTCTGADSQKFVFEGGSLKIFGSKCLDITDGSNTNGNKLQIWDCGSGNANQQFYYTPWGDNHLAWTDHGKCLDLTNSSLDDGNPLQIWDCSGSNPNQIWNVGYMYNQLPDTSETGQYGTNNCGTGSSQNSNCQTAVINSAEDFCLWAPPHRGSIGDTERIGVAWCTKSGRGTRVIPNGTLKGVHFVKTPNYVQVTGVADFTKINIPAGDDGGEYDPHGADQLGNPIGSLVFGSSFGENQQYHEWTSFISEKQFCFRACTGPDAAKLCQHIYDVMGCYWNMPANYDAGVYEECQGDDALPMGVYGTSTWHQGVSPTPAAHPAPASSQCTTYTSIGSSNLKRKRESGFEKMARGDYVEARATPTPAP